MQPENSVTPLNMANAGDTSLSVDANQPVNDQIKPSIDKSELKDLLSEIVTDIHSDKTSEEAVQKLIDEFNTAKNDFLNAMKNVEDAIAKLG